MKGGRNLYPPLLHSKLSLWPNGTFDSQSPLRCQTWFPSGSAELKAIVRTRCCTSPSSPVLLRRAGVDLPVRRLRVVLHARLPAPLGEPCEICKDSWALGLAFCLPLGKFWTILSSHVDGPGKCLLSETSWSQLLSPHRPGCPCTGRDSTSAVTGRTPCKDFPVSRAHLTTACPVSGSCSKLTHFP